MNSPTPLPEASPPGRIRSDQPPCWPPLALVCPRSAWSRWWRSSPRGSTRGGRKWQDKILTNPFDVPRPSECECVGVTRGERDWWETALEFPVFKVFFCLFVWFCCMRMLVVSSSADKYDKLLRVLLRVRESVLNASDVRTEKHLGSTELVRFIHGVRRKTNHTGWSVMGRSFRAPMESRAGESTINRSTGSCRTRDIS